MSKKIARKIFIIVLIGILFLGNLPGNMIVKASEMQIGVETENDVEIDCDVQVESDMI